MDLFQPSEEQLEKLLSKHRIINRINVEDVEAVPVTAGQGMVGRSLVGSLANKSSTNPMSIDFSNQKNAKGRNQGLSEAGRESKRDGSNNPRDNINMFNFERSPLTSSLEGNNRVGTS